MLLLLYYTYFEFLSVQPLGTIFMPAVTHESIKWKFCSRPTHPWVF